MAAQIALINPRRKRKARKTRARRRRHVARRKTTARRRRKTSIVAVRRLNPRRRRVHARRRRHHARRRNPRMLSLGGITRTLMPAAIGGAGALALDIALSYATPYLPASLQSGYLKTGVKLAGAIGLGMVAGKFLGGEKGRAVTLGALTVVLYGAIRDAAKQFAPTLNLGAVDYADNTVGAYMAPSLGYINPAPFVSNDMSGLGAYMSDGM